MTPIQRRAELAYKANDQSRIIRDKTTGKIVGWCDVLGTYRNDTINPDLVSRATRAEIRRDDTIVVQFMPEPDDTTPKGQYDWLVILAFILVLIGIICAYVILSKPDLKYPPTPDGFQPRDGRGGFREPTYDDYKMPPPPGPAERKLLGLDP